MTKEEMEQQIHDFAEMMYKTGYDDGYKVIPSAYYDNYEKGLNDIWKYIKKLGELTIGDTYKIFGDEYNNLYEVAYDYTPIEFIDAIKEYEKQQKCKEDKTLGYGNCSIINNICPYDIKCIECEVHHSIARARNKVKELKGDKE